MTTLVKARVISNFPNLVVNAGFGRIYSFKTDNHFPKDKPVSLLIEDNGDAELYHDEHDAKVRFEEQTPATSTKLQIDTDCIE